jgi:hypothetical protein
MNETQRRRRFECANWNKEPLHQIAVPDWGGVVGATHGETAS